MGWYARLVTKYPWLTILIALLLAAVCGPIGFWYAGFPDFSSPYKGLSPKGTDIYGKDQANIKLTTNIIKGIYTIVPGVNGSVLSNTQDTATTQQVTCEDELITDVTVLPLPPTLRESGAFEEESTALPRLAVQSVNPGQSLWSAQKMRDICSLVDTYIMNELDLACQPFSLPYFIGLLSEKSCYQIADQDMDFTLTLIQSCAPYYYSGELTLNCGLEGTCQNVPNNCTNRNIMFYVFYYFTDKNFVPENALSETFLTYSLIIYRRSYDYSLNEFYSYYKKNLGENEIKSGSVEVKAMDIDVLFGKINSDSVLMDLPFFALAMGLVVVLLFLYLRSLAMMAVVMGNVMLTILVGYFCFFIIFRITFFSFANVIVGLLLIAISADGVFIFYDVFHKIKNEAPDPHTVSIEDVLSKTLKHGFLSVLVTSLTTSAAILSNSIINIVNLRGFGIFGGACMVINIFYLVALVPSVLVILEKFDRSHPNFCECKCTQVIKSHMTRLSNYIWKTIIPPAVINFAPVWIVLLIGLATYGFVAVFYKPALKLPENEEFPVFYPKHPLELYRTDVKNQLRFEVDFLENMRPNINVKFVLGVRGEDNSLILDPDDTGVLILDNSFNLYPSENQIWLKQFCNELIQDTFLNDSSIYQCFMDNYEVVVTSSCSSPQYDATLDSKCCGTQFPLPESDAEFCFTNADFITAVFNTTAYDKSLVGLPVYDLNKKLIAFTHTVTTSYQWSALHSYLKELYTHYEDFEKEQQSTIPGSLEPFWFAGAYGQEFYFYDLQTSLVEGLISGLAMSMGFAFLIMLITSGNFFVSLYAIINISFVVVCTTGALVLLNWRLSVMEALTITMGVGLSIDFTIHFGVGYIVAPGETRSEKVQEAISTIGFAVAMAAVTTFAAGAAMTGAKVLGFYRFGVFFMLNMTLSLIYSLFFFMAVIRFIGPVGNIGKLSALGKCCYRGVTSCFQTKNNSIPSNENLKYGVDNNKNSTPPQVNDVNSKWVDELGKRNKNNRKAKIVQENLAFYNPENTEHHSQQNGMPHMKQQQVKPQYLSVTNNLQIPQLQNPQPMVYFNSGMPYTMVNSNMTNSGAILTGSYNSLPMAATKSAYDINERYDPGKDYYNYGQLEYGSILNRAYFERRSNRMNAANNW